MPHGDTTTSLNASPDEARVTTAPATTTPADDTLKVEAGEGTVKVTASNAKIQSALRWFIGVTNILGIFLPFVFASVLMLIVAIMLVGRLIGVARVTSAYIWAYFSSS